MAGRDLFAALEREDQLEPLAGDLQIIIDKMPAAGQHTLIIGEVRVPPPCERAIALTRGPREFLVHLAAGPGCADVDERITTAIAPLGTAP